jgi:hypothetical protein
VIFGKGCIVHPGCAIVAEAGEIIFGDYNIIEVNAIRKGTIVYLQQVAEGQER